MTRRVIIEESVLTDVVDILSFLEMSIGSAMLSDKCPTAFDLSSLNVCHSVLKERLARRSSTPTGKQGVDLQAEGNVVIFGAESRAKRNNWSGS